jgi:hypothetical protein
MTGCERCASPLEDGDLRCAVCALAVAHVASAAQRGVARASILRCTWCGAATAFDPAHQAPACGFCRSVMEIEQPADPVEEARLVVPFTVERPLAHAALRTWLQRRGWFAPRTLRDEAVLETITPICWAAWIVDARAKVAWTADSDHGANRSAWAPHAGETALTFDRIIVPASRGLDDGECDQLAPFYDLAAAVPVDGTLAVETFDMQRSAARTRVQAAIEERARTGVEVDIPGRRYRNVRVACLIERLTTERVALPAWVLAYRFRGRLYRALVHGQRPEIVFGSSPLDWTKIGLIAAAVAAVALAIALHYVGA